MTSEECQELAVIVQKMRDEEKINLEGTFAIVEFLRTHGPKRFLTLPWLKIVNRK